MIDAEVEMIMRTLVESIQTYEQVVEVRGKLSQRKSANQYFH